MAFEFASIYFCRCIVFGGNVVNNAEYILQNEFSINKGFWLFCIFKSLTISLSYGVVLNSFSSGLTVTLRK